MIDSIRGLGSNNYSSYGASALSGAGPSSQVSSGGESGPGEGCCCCSSGGDSVSLSPEAMEMMEMEKMMAAQQGLAA